MAITFGRDDTGRAWNDPANNEYFIELPGDPDNWRVKGRKLTANESNIETIIQKIPGDAATIKGDHIRDVVDSINNGEVVVVKGVHGDGWAVRLGKHITVKLGAPYLDTYHLYGSYFPEFTRWTVTYISKGMPLKINY
jgi:hypothetical protein